MSSQGVMSSEQTNNNPGLCPIEGQSWSPVARLGPEINSRACLCVPQGLRHNARRCLCIQRFIFLMVQYKTKDFAE